MKWILSILFFANLSFGAAEVTCWGDDCLKNGWTWLHSSGVSNDYGCYRDGCQKDGWIVRGPGRATYTQCKMAGCFNEGWYEINQDNQQLLRNIVCRGSENQPDKKNCMKNGWVIYSTQGQDGVITCHHNDCENKGWLVQMASDYFQVYCKSGGCFKNGWNEM